MLNKNLLDSCLLNIDGKAFFADGHYWEAK